jgi:hypothetical protein
MSSENGAGRGIVVTQDICAIIALGVALTPSDGDPAESGDNVGRADQSANGR